MNLNAVVAPLVGPVNPQEVLLIFSSKGYTTNSDGTRTPNWGTPVSVVASCQNATYDDLQHNNGLNLSGQQLVAYLPGNWTGVIRADQKGGDVIQRADGTVFLVVSVPENWGGKEGWTKVLMTRQLNAADLGLPFPY